MEANIVEQLAAIRRTKNISQQELAEKIPVALSTLGRWERGQLSPSLDSLGKWCKSLGYKLKLEQLK